MTVVWTKLKKQKRKNNPKQSQPNKTKKQTNNLYFEDLSKYCHLKDFFSNSLYMIFLVTAVWIDGMWVLQEIWVFMAHVTFILLPLTWAFE